MLFLVVSQLISIELIPYLELIIKLVHIFFSFSFLKTSLEFHSLAISKVHYERDYLSDAFTLQAAIVYLEFLMATDMVLGANAQGKFWKEKKKNRFFSYNSSRQSIATKAYFYLFIYISNFQVTILLYLFIHHLHIHMLLLLLTRLHLLPVKLI